VKAEGHKSIGRKLNSSYALRIRNQNEVHRPLLIQGKEESWNMVQEREGRTPIRMNDTWKRKIRSFLSDPVDEN
jgi:hypothetical protein